MKIKVITVLGARPQFIKASSVSRAIRLREDVEEIIVHTGQHFDANMSDVFFDQLDIPRPRFNLGISSLSHGAMTGRMLEGIESILLEERPDWVLVYGDTNSTLAGALAAAKLHIRVAHIEAGLRSNNPNMPEEINRVLTDRVSTLLLTPTEIGLQNLKNEGFPFSGPSNRIQRIENVGDVMYDVALHYRSAACELVKLDSYGLEHQGYVLCTLHRQENTEDFNRLGGILSGLRQISCALPVVLPLHPRTLAKLKKNSDTNALSGLTLLDPLPYLEMQRLQMSAKLILTDSGGIQKEAYFHQVPCITLRNESEWGETITAGWNQLVGADPNSIISAAQSVKTPTTEQPPLYGDGHAAQKIVDIIINET